MTSLFFDGLDVYGSPRSERVRHIQVRKVPMGSARWHCALLDATRDGANLHLKWKAPAHIESVLNYFRACLAMDIYRGRPMHEWNE